jgi:hypothetical protein
MVMAATETVDMQGLLSESRTENSHDLLQLVVPRLGWGSDLLQPFTRFSG